MWYNYKCMVIGGPTKGGKEMKKVVKRTVLKRKYKVALTAIGCIVLFTGLLLILNKMDDDFMESCQEAGYSYNYCMENK